MSVRNATGDPIGDARGDSAPGYGAEVRLGALATAPFIAGVAPFGMAYAVSAEAAGFSSVETFLFSVLACSGSAQMASVGLVASGSGPVAIVLTALGLSLRHVLYGLSLGTWHVPASYLHEWRIATPQVPIVLPQAVFNEDAAAQDVDVDARGIRTGQRIPS